MYAVHGRGADLPLSFAFRPRPNIGTVKSAA